MEKQMIRLILATCFWLATLTGSMANEFTKKYCEDPVRLHSCRQVQANMTWETMFPDIALHDRVQMISRQNSKLALGQWVIVPRSDIPWLYLSPLPQVSEWEEDDLIIFDPSLLAWGHYQSKKLVAWGPAVGGQNYCLDIGRSCRTQEGRFFFSEVASPARRSSVYPRGCKGKSCAPMPLFTRFTARGQGIHARQMKGENASHGCVGVFRQNAEYINNLVRSIVNRTTYGWLTTHELELVNRIPLIVLPYEPVREETFETTAER